MRWALLAAFNGSDVELATGWRQFFSPVMYALLLILLSNFSYVWFHSMVELFSVVIGVALYLIALRTFSFTSNAYLLCVATGFFWSSLIDVLHTLTYEGMTKSQISPPDTPLLLWLCARSLQVLALLMAPLYLDGRPLQRWVFSGFGLLAGLLVTLVFMGAFPVVWVEGQGLSPFKIAWEWLLMFLYAIAALRLKQQRTQIDYALYRVMLWVIVLSIATELCFSWYVQMYGLSNLIGHALKLWEYWLMLWVVSQHMLMLPRKLLNDQSELLREVTGKVPGLAYRFLRTNTGEYRFTFVSAGVAQIFELTPAELIADHNLGFQRILPEDLSKVLEESERSFNSMTPWHAEWQVILPRQGRRWHMGDSSIPVRSPDGSCAWIGHIRDITEQMNLQMELTQHRDHLTQLVEKRTEELHIAMALAEQAARVKGEFLANMSHEIRTPLNAINGLSQIALRAPECQPARLYLAQIQDSGRLLLSLVNDILDMSKIDAGKLLLESQPVRLLDIIQRSMRLIVPHAETKKLEFHLDCASDLPEAILTDETRLTQVLINLLGNAVKFTEQGEIHLKVSVTLAAESNWLLLSIRDTGIGMNEEQMSRLFKPFEQGDATTTRRFGGTGLGLTISKRIVELMYGNIDVASQPGMGTCFTVRIPVTIVAAPAAAEVVPVASLKASRRLEGLRILAAEDDPVNQWVLREFLQQEGALLTLRDDGAQALQVLGGSEAFDIFLTDVQMPGLNGYETARRSIALRPGLPVVGLTAYALPEERQRCLNAGMTGHVSKPIVIDTLVTTILSLVSRDQTGATSKPDTLRVKNDSTDSPIDWIAFEKQLSRAPIRRKILDTLLLNHGATATQLRGLAAGEDLESIRRIAHNMRGVAGSIYAEPTRLAAEILENRILETRALDHTMVERLAEAIDTLIAEVRFYLAKAETA